MKFKKILPAIVAVYFLILISSCAKQENMSKTTSEALAAKGKVSNLIDGPCPYPCTDTRCKAYVNGYCGSGGGSTSVSLKTQPVIDPNTKNTMISAFNNLTASGVNLVELSSELGLSYTITSDSIDFNHITMTWDANDPDGKAINAPFKSNSNTNLKGYEFTMYTNGTEIIKPTIISTQKNTYLKYFDLTENFITTINHYNLSSYIISSTYGNYMSNGGAPLSSGCGQRTMNCISDLYTNHGWLSVWATVQTAFIPQTAAAVAATCAIHNCLLN